MYAYTSCCLTRDVRFFCNIERLDSAGYGARGWFSIRNEFTRAENKAIQTAVRRVFPPPHRLRSWSRGVSDFRRRGPDKLKSRPESSRARPSVTVPGRHYRSPSRTAGQYSKCVSGVTSVLVLSSFEVGPRCEIARTKETRARRERPKRPGRSPKTTSWRLKTACDYSRSTWAI